MKPAIEPIDTRRHVLLAEDSTITQDILQLALSKKGHFLTIVNNAEEAIDKLKAEYYDIALIDFHLPDRSGIELVREYFHSNQKGLIPRLVALTGDAEEVRDLEKFDCHFDLVFAKPFAISDLVDIVEAESSRARPFGDEISPYAPDPARPTPLLPRRHSFHIIYFPHDFYSSFKNAVSIAIAKNGPADAIVIDQIPTPEERIMLAKIKGLGGAAYADRTGHFGYESDLSFEEESDINSELREGIATRQSRGDQVHPSHFLSKDIRTNLLMSMFLRGEDLIPHPNFNYPYGVAYNNILSAMQIIEIASSLVGDGFLNKSEGRAIYRCPNCNSARVHPMGFFADEQSHATQFLCTDCEKELGTSDLLKDRMKHYALTDAGKNHLFTQAKLET